MRIKKTIKYFCIAALLCFLQIKAFAVETAQPQAAQFSPVNIGLKIKQGQDIIAASDFYPVLINQKEQPYINVAAFFSKLFVYDVNCNDLNRCEIISKPADWNFTFSLAKHNVTVINKGKTHVYPLDDQSLVEQNGELWLRYDQLDKILPNESRWDIRAYQLTIDTQLPVLEMIIEKRKTRNQKILTQQQQRELEAQQASKIPPLTPQHPIDAALFYQLTDNEAVSGSNSSNRQAQFSGVSDIMQGTLAATGSVSQPKTGPTPYNWNYTLSKQPYFRLLQVGDTNSDTTPFLGTYTLSNGIKFDKIQEQNAYLQFVYYGQTLPGTEIDVWRNGTFLVGVFYADSSGQFTITDNQANPGDVYTLDYYYTNGKEKVDYVRFAPDKGSLLKEGDFDTDFNYGRMDQNDLFMGHVGESMVRYGLSPGLTIGWGTYYLNFGDDFYNANIDQLNQQTTLIHYADLAWQAFDSLNVQIDKMLNTSGYAIHTTSNYFQNNLLEVSYRKLSETSPLLLIPSSLSNATAYKMLEVKDSFSFSRWRWVNDYWNTNLNKEINSTLNSYYSKWFAPALTVDINKPTGSNSVLTTQVSNTMMIGANSFMQLGYAWIKGSGSTQSIQYTYNGGTEKNYSLSVGMVHNTALGSNQPNLSLNWRATPNWNFGFSYINSGLLLSVSFIDAVSLFKSPQLPGQYALGSVSGKVLSPKIAGQVQQPLEGVKISVGGNSAVTDKNGNYLISGIQTGQVVYLEVDPDSLDVSMLPEASKVPLFFRPGTHIEYNPVIVTNIGIDGYVLSDVPIPDDAKIVAVQQGSSLERAAKVENDGFFSIEKLSPGQYTLKLTGVSNPPAPYPLKISPEQTWISNLRIKWQYTDREVQKPAQTETAKQTSAPLSEAVILSNSGILISPANQEAGPIYYCPPAQTSSQAGQIQQKMLFSQSQLEEEEKQQIIHIVQRIFSQNFPPSHAQS